MHSPIRATRDASARYAVAIFLSSSLLFLLEPVAGKRILPLLGGSAAVWTACLVFFQCALLAGYASAHWLATRTRRGLQITAYAGLIVASVGQLALTANAELRADPFTPIVSVLWLLTMLIGLPFLTLSMTSPLLQSWYARSAAAPGAGTGPRPYRLFAISNAGSLIALVLYPWLVEPRFSLRLQVLALACGVALLAAVVALLVRGLPRWALPAPEAPQSGVRTTSAAPDTVRTRAVWVLLAASASFLLSAVTIHLSENVATFPLLWIIPLVAYLLSFVVAFSELRLPRKGLATLGAAGVVAAIDVMSEGELHTSVPMAVVTFCGMLFVVSLFCHAELYRRRPPASRLTAFYLYVAGGGALGALAVGIGAPTLLSGNYELFIGLALAAAIALLAGWDLGWAARLVWAVMLVAPCVLLAKRVVGDRANLLLHERNFYGTLKVTQVYWRDYEAPARILYHGLIEHGEQVFRVDLRRQPTSYYGHPSGVGLALDLCCGDRPRRIGVIGLGTGTIAAYGRPGDVIRFYDINPAVEPIARNTFAYLRDSPARIDVVTGDARVSLSHEAPQRYDVLVVDAFSGDAIPIHLITTEALALYRRHLAPGGIIAFHVSNRYLDLPPVVQELADSAHMRTAYISTDDDFAHDLYGADWVLVTTNADFLAGARVARARKTIRVRPGLRLWTDDYNSLLPIVRIHKR